MSAYIDAPGRLHQTWDWFVAVYAWDYGEPEVLAELIRSEPIPAEYREAVAAIVAGERKPNLRAAAKMKIPAQEHLRLAGSVSVVIELCATIKQQAIEVGDRKALEPIDIIREAENESREAVFAAANEFGVSVETVENILRVMRARIAAWPVV